MWLISIIILISFSRLRGIQFYRLNGNEINTRIQVAAGNMDFIKGIFDGCIAESGLNGGAICFLSDEGLLNLSKCKFLNCRTKSGNGGALYIGMLVSLCKIQQSKFEQCETQGNGGAIYFTAEHGDLILDDVKILQCNSIGNYQQNGLGGGLFINKWQEISIVNSIIEECKSIIRNQQFEYQQRTINHNQNSDEQNLSNYSGGGGIAILCQENQTSQNQTINNHHCYLNKVKIIECISENGNGGGILIMSQSIVDRSQDQEIQNTFILELDNVRIAKCKSDIYGGAIFLGGQLLSGQEYNNEMDVKLIMEKTKFINNEAGNGNDIFIQSRWLQNSVLEGDASSIPNEQTWGGSVNKGTFNNAQSNSQEPRVCGALALTKESNELNYDKEANSDIMHVDVQMIWINNITGLSTTYVIIIILLIILMIFMIFSIIICCIFCGGCRVNDSLDQQTDLCCCSCCQLCCCPCCVKCCHPIQDDKRWQRHTKPVNCCFCCRKCCTNCCSRKCVENCGRQEDRIDGCSCCDADFYKLIDRNRRLREQDQLQMIPNALFDANNSIPQQHDIINIEQPLQQLQISIPQEQITFPPQIQLVQPPLIQFNQPPQIQPNQPPPIPPRRTVQGIYYQQQTDFYVPFELPSEDETKIVVQ